MEKLKLLARSFANALGAAVYIAAVAWVMFNGEKIFGHANSFLLPLSLLLLFVVSATIVGLLVLGWPVIMYLAGQKSEAWKLLFYTIGWLVVIMVIVFACLKIGN